MDYTKSKSNEGEDHVCWKYIAPQAATRIRSGDKENQELILES